MVRPVESFRGDGPIISTKLLYKPMDNGVSWSSIIGEPAGGGTVCLLVRWAYTQLFGRISYFRKILLENIISKLFSKIFVQPKNSLTLLAPSVQHGAHLSD